MMNVSKEHPPVVMVIGGLDPSGGAGLCADIQTLSAMGCHAAPVITAITEQDTIAVRSFQPVEASLVEAQMRAVMKDLSPAVVKTGMLANSEIISAVSSLLKEFPDIRLIVDPVISSNNDEPLSEGLLIESFVDVLFPITTIITPNIPEAQLLADRGLSASETIDTSVDDCAARLSETDCLITGTHADSSTVINRYYQRGIKVREWSWPRLEYEYHGSGCTLASAIAAATAQGLEMEEALELAQQFVIKSLQSGFKPGHGQHIPDRLNRTGQMLE